MEMDFVKGCLFIIAIVLFYFLPSIIAAIRNHSNFMSIVVINLFFGWTLVGWVICLAWGFSDNVCKKTRVAVKQKKPELSEFVLKTKIYTCIICDTQVEDKFQPHRCPTCYGHEFYEGRRQVA